MANYNILWHIAFKNKVKNNIEYLLKLNINYFRYNLFVVSILMSFKLNFNKYIVFKYLYIIDSIKIIEYE